MARHPRVIWGVLEWDAKPLRKKHRGWDLLAGACGVISETCCRGRQLP